MSVNFDKLLSNFAFNFNLRPSSTETDRLFSIGIRGAMQDQKYAARLRAAIDSSPYMQAAVSEEQRRRAEGRALQ